MNVERTRKEGQQRRLRIEAEIEAERRANQEQI